MAGKQMVVTAAGGGMGKSTVTAALACGLALRGQKVLVLDCNPLLEGAAIPLGAERGTPYHMGDVLSNGVPLPQVISPCGAPGTEGIFLMRAPRNPADLPEGEILHQWMVYFQRRYDWILLDLPWSSPCFAEAVAHASQTLVLCEAKATAAEQCSRLCQSDVGQAMQHPRLVLNRFHRKEFWQRGEFSDLDQVIDRCTLQLLAVIPEQEGMDLALPQRMRRTLSYEALPFLQKGDAGVIALHCLAERLLGKQVPLRPLDRLSGSIFR